LYRPYTRRRGQLLRRQRARVVDRDTEGVLVVDIAADDPPKRGFYEDVAVAGPSGGQTNRRSGFAKWKEEAEGVNQAPRLASHLRISGSRPESTTEPVTGDNPDSLGNIVSLISNWKRRTLLLRANFEDVDLVELGFTRNTELQLELDVDST
jgi:hypothetical protein